jgi:hypothetical protein
MKPRLFVIALACCLLATSVGSAAWACHACCQPCQPCCAPPPPVPVTLCVKDPCNCCCAIPVEVCLPACCAGEVPCVKWRSGIFGRRIATYCWPCCGHSIDVVITRHGKVRVR